MNLLKVFFAMLLLFFTQCKATKRKYESESEPDSKLKLDSENNSNPINLLEENEQSSKSSLISALVHRNLEELKQAITNNPESIDFEAFKVAIMADFVDGFEMLLDSYTEYEPFNLEFNQDIFKIIAIKSCEENDTNLLFNFVGVLSAKLDFNSKLALIEHIVCEYSDHVIVGSSIDAVSISINSKYASGIVDVSTLNNQKFAIFWLVRALSFKVDSVELFERANYELSRCDINEIKELINNYTDYVKDNTSENVEYLQPKDLIEDIELFKKLLNDIISGAEKRLIGIRVLETAIAKSNIANKFEFQEAFGDFIKNRVNALFATAEKGYVNDVKHFLDIGADVNSKNVNGVNALMIAAKRGHGILVNVLLEIGANVNAQDNQRYTALMLAALWDRRDIVKDLLKHGADVNAQNEDGHTALMIAAKGGYGHIVNVLLEKGANVNAQDNQGCTALMLAALWDRRYIVKDLLKHGADVNAQNYQGYTALMYAVENGYSDIFNTLLRKGADVDSKSTSGWTVLMIAAEKGYGIFIKALLRENADVNLQNNFGYTALMYAVKERYVLIVNDLLEKGADVNLTNKEGITALMIAQNLNDKIIVTLLSSPKAKIVKISGNNAEVECFYINTF